MSLLAFLVLSQTVTPKAVFDRYAAFRSAHPVLSADWSVTRGTRDLAHGTIALDGAKRLLFKATNGTLSYSLSETELGGIEIVPNDQTYDEFPAARFISIPPSRIGQEASFIPSILLRTDLFAPRAKYKMEPSQTIGGVTADVVSWVVTMGGNSLKFEMAVDPEGRIVEFSRESEQGGMGGPGMGHGRPSGARPGGAAPGPVPPPVVTAPGPMGQASPPAPSTKLTWTISNYRWNWRGSLTAFYTPIPKGFVPYAVPSASEVAIEVDQQFPSAPWKVGGKMVDLKAATAGKPALIVITAPDSAPSQAAASSTGRLKAGIPGTPVELVSLARTAATAKGLPFDSTGKAAMAIGQTSIPLFVLIDGTGKITNLWTGFDPAAEPQFLKEVQVAIKTVLDTPPAPAPTRTPPKAAALR